MPDSSQDGRRRRGDASRGAALACAVAIAQVEGLEGLSFGRVAKEACMAKSSLQALFADREKLQLETLASGAEAFATRVAAALIASCVPESRPLLRLCEAWFDTIEQAECRGCLLTAAVAEYRGREGAIPSAIRAGQARWTDALQRAATAAVATVEIGSQADVEQIVFEVQAFQAAANVAAAMGDFQGVARARAAVRARIGRDEPGRSRP